MAKVGKLTELQKAKLKRRQSRLHRLNPFRKFKGVQQTVPEKPKQLELPLEEKKEKKEKRPSEEETLKNLMGASKR